jgi:hypothetical protein
LPTPHLICSRFEHSKSPNTIAKGLELIVFVLVLGAGRHNFDG